MQTIVWVVTNPLNAPKLRWDLADLRGQVIDGNTQTLSSASDHCLVNCHATQETLSSAQNSATTFVAIVLQHDICANLAQKFPINPTWRNTYKNNTNIRKLLAIVESVKCCTVFRRVMAVLCADFWRFYFSTEIFILLGFIKCYYSLSVDFYSLFLDLKDFNFLSKRMQLNCINAFIVMR